MLLMLRFNSFLLPSLFPSFPSFQIFFRQEKKKNLRSAFAWCPRGELQVTSMSSQNDLCTIMARTLGWSSGSLALALVFPFTVHWILGKSLDLSAPVLSPIIGKFGLVSDFQTLPGSPQILTEVPWGLSQEECCDREGGGYIEETRLSPIPISPRINILVKLFLTLTFLSFC